MIAVCLLFFVDLVSAMTANSSNYSTDLFGMGLAAGDASSDNYNSSILLESDGNTRNAMSEDYTVNLGFFNNTSPYSYVSINSYSIYPRSVTAASIIRFYVSALNSQATWVVLTRPDGVVETLDIINNDYTYYIAGLVGRYNIIFYANSTIGTISSVVDYFELTAAVSAPASASAAGGGGDSGGIIKEKIIEKCSTIWDCTPWSLCLEGKQKRNCRSLGTCTEIGDKPVEEMVCTDALFDIVLKLGTLNLNSDGKLIFDIYLDEKLNRESIDVHIKYSLINEEPYDLFNQIETVAIKGSLYISKEISGLLLKDGEYILRVDILYGNLQRSFAEQKFNVFEGKIQLEKTTEVKIEEALSVYDKIVQNMAIILLIGGLILALFFARIFWLGIKKIGSMKLFKFGKKVKKTVQKEYPINSYLGLIGKQVFAETGNIVGVIKDVTIENKHISGWLIELDKGLVKRIGKSKILVEHKFVSAIGKIVILKREVADHLDKLSK